MMFDALIIGSGPAGAAAARLLAQAGWSVALVEKASFPRRKVCGEFISAATLPVLEACGVAERFLAAAGPPVTRVAAYAGDTMVEAPLPRASAGSGWGRALGREHLDVLLRDAAVAAGARLFQPAEVTALRRTAEGHSVTLEMENGAEEIAARTVIAACGSWNTKGPFAIAAVPKPSDLFAFKAHFTGGALPSGVMPLVAYPGGYGGLVECEDGRFSLSCCIRRDVLARVRQSHGGKAAEAVFSHICATTKGVRLALENATPDGVFLSTGPLHPGMRAFHHDGIYFTGNIAGEANPSIAEGISMAIQSSWLLAQILIAGKPAADYARAWRRQFSARFYTASAVAHLSMNGPGRAAGALVIAAFPQILTWGAALSGKAKPVMTRSPPPLPHAAVRHDAA